MAQKLGIEIVDFIRGVMNMLCCIRSHEKRMVIDESLASIDVAKETDFFLPVWCVLVIHKQEIRWHDVEILCVKLNLFL